MATDNSDETEATPWPQRLFDSVWLLALAAVIYWLLAYVVWGVVDIMSVPMG